MIFGAMRCAKARSAMLTAPKVHIAIGHERSLCGLSPRHGHYDIRTMATFFQSADGDQCGRCLYLLKQRGYLIKRLRESAVSMPRANVIADREAHHV